ncbi:unnamed protein product [Albugo candida]|uniref:Superoxide dismutase [Fe] n=1 Tax=Albugo candida TaxID=65357 RepID=A0A024G952_9STRA|nr:unnamed protein product [Albugo candida]|eukprot:CCI43080.1 unnamed protein product [Albugo candida]
MSIEFPNLPYSYSALEPYIDTLTMNLHHAQHHQTYVHSLKKFLETEQNGELKGKDIVEIIQNAKAEKIRNNGGGHYNHSLFWLWLAPPGTANSAPYGNLSARIDADFGSIDAMKTQFNAAAATRFGSGWAWLGVGSNGKLGITSTPNQDNPLMPDVDEPMIPILGLDVWEHSYFLKYQNRRPEYIHAFWKLVNWDQVVYCYDEHASKQKPVPVEMYQGGELKDKDIVQVVQNAKAEPIRNNAGGHYNHSLFWTVMGPPGSVSQAPGGKLKAKIQEAFGSIDRMKEEFGTVAAERFGSGWAWLGVKPDGTVGITSTMNQDNPLMPNAVDPMIPIMGLDVWEHAYYLKYHNRRKEYISAFWNITNWDQVTANYDMFASKQNPIPIPGN